MMSEKQVIDTLEALYQHYMRKQLKIVDVEKPNTFAKQNELVIEALEFAICELTNSQWKHPDEDEPKHMQRVQVLTSERVVVSAIFLRKEGRVFLSTGSTGVFLHDGLEVQVLRWRKYPAAPYLEEAE